MDSYGQEKDKKRAAISLRDGGQLQTKVWRCGEIEQNAEKEAIDKECRSRSPSALLRTERAAMPLIRETLPLRRITAIGHKSYWCRSKASRLTLHEFSSLGHAVVEVAVAEHINLGGDWFAQALQERVCGLQKCVVGCNISRN